MATSTVKTRQRHSQEIGDRKNDDFHIRVDASSIAISVIVYASAVLKGDFATQSTSSLHSVANDKFDENLIESVIFRSHKVKMWSLLYQLTELAIFDHQPKCM